MIVAVRGVDGSGKTTAVSTTVDELRRVGVPARSVKMALVANPAFARFRPVLRDTTAVTAALLRRALAVGETLRTLVEDILPYHSSGEVVVCDRYWQDTVDYLRLRDLATAETDQALAGLPPPDVEVILNVPLAIAEQRTRGLGESWSEQLRALLVGVHAALAERPAHPGVYHLDATRPASAIAAQIVQVVHDRLGRSSI